MNQPQMQIIALPIEFDEPALAGLQKEMNEELAKGNALQLDAQFVERFDAAALQFVLCFAQSEHALYPMICQPKDELLAGFLDIGTDEKMLTNLFGENSQASGISA